MKYLSLADVLALHARIIEDSGGSTGIRDEGLLESAIAQPRQSFGGVELYSDIAAKAATLGFSLIKNHPFVDGNKRIGHAAVETFLVINGHEIESDVDEAEEVVLRVASSEMTHEEWETWLRGHIVPTALD